MIALFIIGFFYTWFVASVSIMAYKKFNEPKKQNEFGVLASRQRIKPPHSKHTYNLPRN